MYNGDNGWSNSSIFNLFRETHNSPEPEVKVGSKKAAWAIG
jgi:hypothetical protein